MAFTYFFRDMYTLELIAQHVIPQLTGRRHICVWDAGCAMGPEPYSIAITFRENMGQFAFRNLQIHATDIDDSNLFGKIIQEGSYPDEQVKRIPRSVFNKYFKPDTKPGYFQISDEIRACVSYQRHDLLSLQPIRDGISLIVCKNVILHFKEEERVNVLKMFSETLLEGGILVMEQTQKMPEEVAPFFKRCTTDGQIFQKIGSPR
ncbi:MAG TPA: chemotaxis protein CheR [Dehalococcoidia bacterium]|nr:chemotaxis protein CheR [Dehalococcoidia bacterium]